MKTAHNEITGDTIATKHSRNYGEGFDMIKNRQPAEGCECLWRDRALGDGCQYCNPELAAEILADNERENEE